MDDKNINKPEPVLAKVGPKQKTKKQPITLLLILLLLFIVVDVGIATYFLYFRNQPINDEVTDGFVIDPVDDQPLVIANVLVSEKSFLNANDLNLMSVTVDPKIPSYDLPLDLSQIDNLEAVKEKINMSDQALSKIQENGFVVIDNMDLQESQKDDFVNYYKNLKNKDIPIFITSDSLLHYYHIFFDTTLLKLERDLFYDDIWQISQILYDDALELYNSSEGDLQESAKRNLAYLSVALDLLQPKSNQILSDKTLRLEYCDERMDEEVCQSMISGVKETYGEKASLKYFSKNDVSKYSFEMDDAVTDLVKEELDLIDEHEGWEFSPIFVYKEDYSQYVPRGHYTKSEKLRNYFKAMMWYGRMTGLLAGSDDHEPGTSTCNGMVKAIISEYDAKIQTIQSGLIAQKFLTDEVLVEKWKRIYAITSFFAGFSDDLGPFEYGQAIKNVLGDEFSVSDLETKVSEINSAVDELIYEPKIYGGLGQCEMIILPVEYYKDQDRTSDLVKQHEELLRRTKGFRLMGQRFTIDSYIFSNIVSPHSGEYTGDKLEIPKEKDFVTFAWDYSSDLEENRPFTWVKTKMQREVRGFPRGLDVMSLLGSERAKEVIKELGDDQYNKYYSKLDELALEIDGFAPEDWHQNIYWNWLYSLQGLLENYGEGYQSFMQTDAWQDKQLNTALASWTELRHDTILYVKQSYTMAEMGAGYVPPVVGYVEPVPEFYTRLYNLTNITKTGLSNLIPEEELEDLRIEYALDQFMDVINRLTEISQKELANEALSDEEYKFIEGFGDRSKELIEVVAGGDVDPKVIKTVLVADVHTDGNSEKVLEEGVGYLKTMLVSYKLPDDRILLGVGPVFSYYEFKNEMADRLTDEAWRDILDSGNHPDQPKWVKSFTE